MSPPAEHLDRSSGESAAEKGARLGLVHRQQAVVPTPQAARSMSRCGLRGAPRTVFFWSCLAATMAWAGGCDDPLLRSVFELPRPVKTPAAPAADSPTPQPIQLAELNPIRLDPGQHVHVELQVQRNANEGPIQVEANGAPKGISAAPLEIPAGQSAGQLEITAAESLGSEELKGEVRVVAKLDELKAERASALTVNKISLPRFLPVADVILQPGAAATVDLTIERSGYQGPLTPRVEDLPAKVAGKVAPIADAANGTRLELKAAADAPPGRHAAKVVATLYGRNVAVEIPLRIDKQPYHVQSFMVVRVKPGGSERTYIPVERRTYHGPLSLRVAGLPEGVTAPEVSLTGGQTEAVLEFAAAEDARECVRSVQVVSTGGGLTSTDPLVLRVTHGESGYLPREVTADPELMHLLRRGSFGGRLTAEGKQALLDVYGGTLESERAVLLGLAWLARHQQSDGRWPLKEYWKSVSDCDCGADCEKEVMDSDTAGTAFGLLPFLAPESLTTGRRTSRPSWPTTKRTSGRPLCSWSRSKWSATMRGGLGSWTTICTPTPSAPWPCARRMGCPAIVACRCRRNWR